MEECGADKDTQCGVDPARLQEGHGGVEREEDIPHGGPAPPPHPGLAHRPVDSGLDKELRLGGGGDDVRLPGLPLCPRHQVGIFSVRVGGLIQECCDGDVELLQHVLGEVLVGHLDQLGELVPVLMGEEGQLAVALEEVQELGGVS